MIVNRFIHIPLDALFIEAFFGLAVIVLCAFIVLKVNSIYELTHYRGLYYFRNIFLFFGLAYFIRSFHVYYTYLLQNTFPIQLLMLISLFLVTYFSTLSFTFIVLSLGKRFIPKLFHSDSVVYTIAAFVSLFVLLTQTHLSLIAVQVIVLLFFMLTLFFMKSKKRHFLSQNKVTFLLIMAFWILTIVPFGKPFIAPVFRIPIYLLLLGIFVWITIRVKRSLEHGKKKR